MRRFLTIIILAVLAAFQGLADQCGELPCTYMLVPMRALGETLGFKADYDQVQVFMQAENLETRAFLVTVRYRWQGQAAESVHVALRWPDGSSILTLFFYDIRDVQIESIDIRTLGFLR
jgi:hypothetical protein